MPDRLRKIIEHFGLSQRGLAGAIGVNPSQVSFWLSGESSMPQSTAMAFEAAFGVRWQWLLNGEGEMLLAKSGHLTDDQKTMVDLMSALTPDQRMRLIGMAEGMIAARRLGKGKT